MKKNSTPLMTWMPLASMIFIFPSCQKALDYSKDHGKGQADAKLCNIRQITVHSGQQNVVYTFTYNAAGDPVTVKNTAVGTGNPNTVFKYDRYGRLAEMIRPYANAQYETWTKYSYNNNGLIVRDTQYVFGTYVDSLPKVVPQFGYKVTHYTYDGLDRIVSRTDSSFGLGGTTGTTTSMHYDVNGNLSSATAYDSHLNFLRTHKTWMFLTNNYSLNNNFQATAYNEHELPLAFQGPSQVMAPVVSVDGVMEVQYACDVMKK